MKRLATAAMTMSVACAALTLALPALAEEHREGGRHEEGRSREPGRAHDGGRWHGGIEHFHERDFHTWRGGHWEHRWRDGRYGWWWFAGGLWYLYPSPIYPYPDPYAPPVVLAPPAVRAPVEPTAPPPAQYWYYCDSASGYYPYVPACPSGWRAVPATPAR